VWWAGNGNEASTEVELGGGSAQALGEGEKRWGGCGENQRRHLPFIGAVGWWGRRQPVSYGVEMPVINGRPLLGTGDAGWPSKGGALKVGFTIGWFAMAQRWVAGLRGMAACVRRRRCSIELGEEEGHRPGWASWTAQAR
jgi:hypothetical protein